MSARRFPDGWIPATGTWTYVSATTFTVPTADSKTITIGDRILLTQTTAKYFVVTGLSGTTITITGGTTYTLANAAITLPYFSHEASPLGYPAWFDFAPVVTAAAGTFTSVASVARFCVVGRACTFVQTITTTTVGSATTATVTTLPIAAATGAQNIATGSGMETNSTGDSLTARITGSNALTIRNYANAFDGGAAAVQRTTITYEI